MQHSENILKYIHQNVPSNPAGQLPFCREAGQSGTSGVTKYICASGMFSMDDIADRLNIEILNESVYKVQYWPILELTSTDLTGCCGLRPYKENEYEIGFFLR